MIEKDDWRLTAGPVRCQTLDRIRRMEALFDALQAAMTATAPVEEECLRQMRQELTEYYEGGQWLADYHLDEAGGLPKDLKRGVLSQDGVYNLLCSIDDKEKEKTPHEC